MFDNSKDIRTKIEDVTDNESCYGGFGGRFSYERFQSARSGHTRSGSRIINGICTVAVLAVLGLVCGAVMFHIVEAGQQIYYPGLDTVDLAVNSLKLGKESSIETRAVGISSDDIDPLLEVITHEVSEKYRVPMGVMIKHIDEGSAAHRAGFEEGDIIVSIDGIDVLDMYGINSAISNSAPNSMSTITVFRNNEYRFTFGIEFIHITACDVLVFNQLENRIAVV